MALKVEKRKIVLQFKWNEKYTKLPQTFIHRIMFSTAEIIII